MSSIVRRDVSLDARVPEVKKLIEDSRDADPDLFAYRLIANLDKHLARDDRSYEWRQRFAAIRSGVRASISIIVVAVALAFIYVFVTTISHDVERAAAAAARNESARMEDVCNRRLQSSTEQTAERVREVTAERDQCRAKQDNLDDGIKLIVDTCRRKP